MQFENVCGSNLFPIVFLHFVTLVLLYSPTQGESPKVTGPSQPIKALIGNDVILPCFLVPPADVEDMALEWSRPDYKPDPGDFLNRKYVYLQRDHQEIRAMKNPSYHGRTSLFKEALKDGNLSLKLINITLSDEGKYRCFIPKLRSQYKESIIHLVVSTSPIPESTTDAPQTAGPDRRRKTEVKEGDSLALALSVGISVAVVLVLLVAGAYILITKPWRKPKALPTETRDASLLNLESIL